jgi:hypothetical protein
MTIVARLMPYASSPWQAEVAQTIKPWVSGTVGISDAVETVDTVLSSLR